jgi:hypothetical protein
MRVPFGVVVLGVLAIFAGVLYLMEGIVFLEYVVFGPVPSGDGRVLAGILAVAVGIVWVAFGVAAFSLKPWAWLFGVVLAMFGLFGSLVTLLTTLSWEYAIATAVLPAIVLWYLNRDKVKQAFGLDNELV